MSICCCLKVSMKVGDFGLSRRKSDHGHSPSLQSLGLGGLSIVLPRNLLVDGSWRGPPY